MTTICFMTFNALCARFLFSFLYFSILIIRDNKIFGWLHVWRKLFLFSAFLKLSIFFFFLSFLSIVNVFSYYYVFIHVTLLHSMNTQYECAGCSVHTCACACVCVWVCAYGISIMLTIIIAVNFVVDQSLNYIIAGSRTC